ncbi:MarR family winged helix-turn-helix transcriptional regulator [Kineococcus esterisolvens]|uniref:MarR family winged helix-turn-helix transcriptional regulator n=1 Tax=unclassified Kineococcus TaxID=2621656 RepID=UPI003D7CEA01
MGTTAQPPPADGELADLADLLMTVARDLQGRHGTVEGVVALTATETTVMRHLDRNPGTSPSAAAAATGLQRSNLSATVRSLEAKGLVERSHDAHDGRAVALHPTALAARNLGLLRTHWASRLRRALDAGDGHDDGHGHGDAVRSALALLERVEHGLAADR